MGLVYFKELKFYEAHFQTSSLPWSLATFQTSTIPPVLWVPYEIKNLGLISNMN